MKPASDTRFYHFFGINDSPFSIAPDPHYLFLGEKHQEALAHLFYGIGNEGGFIVLTGEVGTGKTMICRTILQQMPDATDVAYIVNPRLDANELLQSICDELGLFYDAEERTNKVMLDILTKFLLASHARGRHTLLIIDEAQNLSTDVLEQIRLLTNLETNEKKLLQLVLIGQPELADMLASRELRQLSQRVTARYHLETLTRSETGNYIAHRLKVAGFQGPLFSSAALRNVYRATGGVPRLINVLCERCMLGAYVSESRAIDAAIVKRAGRELKAPERKSRRFRRKLDDFMATKLLTPGLAVLMLGLGIYYGSAMQNTAPPVQLASTPQGDSRLPLPTVVAQEPEPVVKAVIKEPALGTPAAEDSRSQRPTIVAQEPEPVVKAVIKEPALGTPAAEDSRSQRPTIVAQEPEPVVKAVIKEPALGMPAAEDSRSQRPTIVAQEPEPVIKAVIKEPVLRTPATETAAVTVVQRRELALRELASRWQIEIPVGEPICEVVSAEGLSCLEMELAVDKLAQLGLPGVIESRSNAETSFTVVETSADIRQLARQPESVRFWVLWRSPPLAARNWPYALGDKHDGVSWVQQRLNWYQGRQYYWVREKSDESGVAVRDRFDWLYARSPLLVGGAKPRQFGTAMRDELRQLQQQLGWQATGQGDLLTLIKLDTMTNTRAPSLVHSG